MQQSAVPEHLVAPAQQHAAPNESSQPPGSAAATPTAATPTAGGTRAEGAATTADAPPTPRPGRFYALDALRGLAIALMVFVDWAGNSSLPPDFAHSDWNGLTLADTVFPGFMVAMGTAMPYATRTGWRRAFGRAILLYLIGSAVVSYKYGLVFGLYPGILQMLGVSYLLTWLITRLPRPVHFAIVAALMAGISAAYLWVNTPGAPAGSFAEGANLAEWFDGALHFTPAPENPHAWVTAVGSVYIGVIAGEIAKATTGWRRRGWLTVLGVTTMALGYLLSIVIPLNKHLWTPSYVLVTGGMAVCALVVLSLLIPPGSKGGPLRPLVILGGHAIVVYIFSETIIGHARTQWLWPTWEPIVTERYGELAAGVAYPLGAVLVCIALAWTMELLKIRVRL